VPRFYPLSFWSHGRYIFEVSTPTRHDRLPPCIALSCCSRSAKPYKSTALGSWKGIFLGCIRRCFSARPLHSTHPASYTFYLLSCCSSTLKRVINIPWQTEGLLSSIRRRAFEAMVGPVVISTPTIAPSSTPNALYFLSSYSRTLKCVTSASNRPLN